jgi:hypothetical protein
MGLPPDRDYLIDFLLFNQQNRMEFLLFVKIIIGFEVMECT